MRKALLWLTFLSSLGVFIVQSGCGGNSPPQSQSSNNMGTVAVFGGDSPVCSVIAFEVTLTGVTLTPQGGGVPVSLLPSGQSQRVDFAALTGFNTLLNVASAPEGVYDQATITLADPQITILDTTQNPPAPKTIPTMLERGTVTVGIRPLLNVTAGSATGINLDFRLLQALQVDSQGQLTGKVIPAFQVTPNVTSIVNGLGRIDEFRGVVQNVTTSSNNPSFTGSFTVEMGSGRVFQVEVTSSTQFEGISGLGALAPGTFVEVDVFVDSKGNIVAREVELQQPPTTTFSGFAGTVASVVRDNTGRATQFNLLVRHEWPRSLASVPVHSLLTVNIASTTIFRIGFMAQSVNEAQLTFDPTTLGVGEQVGVFAQLNSGTPPTADARGIVLQPFGYVGNFTALLATGKDGKTGGFTAILCSPVLEGNPVTVLTFADTEFSRGLTDLSSLSTSQDLLILGLLFYQPSPITANGVTVSAPGWVLEARVVRKLR